MEVLRTADSSYQLDERSHSLTHVAWKYNEPMFELSGDGHFGVYIFLKICMFYMAKIYLLKEILTVHTTAPVSVGDWISFVGQNVPCH